MNFVLYGSDAYRGNGLLVCCGQAHKDIPSLFIYKAQVTRAIFLHLIGGIVITVHSVTSQSCPSSSYVGIISTHDWLCLSGRYWHSHITGRETGRVTLAKWLESTWQLFFIFITLKQWSKDECFITLRYFLWASLFIFDFKLAQQQMSCFDIEKKSMLIMHQMTKFL